MNNRLGMNGNSTIKQRLGINPQKVGGNSGFNLKGGDARLKLIQKKRQNISDARERLNEIGKQGDARQKLNKMRNLKKLKQPVLKGPMSVQKTIISPNIGRVMTNGNKVQSLMQIPHLNKIVVNNEKAVGNQMPQRRGIIQKQGLDGMTRLTSGSLTRTVSGFPKATPIQNSLTVTKRVSNPISQRYHPLPSNPNVVTIRNEKVVAQNKVGAGFRSSQPQLKAKRSLRPPLTSPPQLSYPPRRPTPIQPLMNLFKGNIWNEQIASPHQQQEIKPTRLQITTTNNYMDYDAPIEEENWRSYSPPRIQAVKRPYEDYGDYLPSPPPKKPNVLSSNIISRLDQQMRPSHPGYKVMVTNLHPVVTVDDVEELFRNIGPIKQARIIREGIAEVMFVNEDDAYSSVEVYHNRQLDGQVMNVTVVSKKSAAPLPSRYSPERPRFSTSVPPSLRKPRVPMNVTSTSGLIKNSHSTKSVLRTAGGSSYDSYDAAMNAVSDKRSQKIDVSPDINTIHHALFSGKNGNPGSNIQQVYIKLPKHPLRSGK